MNCDNGLAKADNNTTEHVLSTLSLGNKNHMHIQSVS